VIVLLHGYAILITLMRGEAAFNLEGSWLVQDLVLLGISGVSSLVLTISGGRWATGLVPVMVFCFAIVSYSNGSFIIQDVLLLMCIGCQIGMFLNKLAAQLLSIGIAILILVVKWPALFTGKLPPLSMVLWIAILVTFELFLITLAETASELFARFAQQREMNERLDNAVAQLTSANLGFQQHAFVVEEESAENERRRISREIHDTVGYVMTNIIMMMEEAGSLLGGGPERVRQLLNATRSQAQQGWTEARLALRALRTLRGEEVVGIQAIVRLANAFSQATGVKIRLELGNVPMRFPDEIDAVAYRFVQEGLTNSFRHGRATTIDIFCWMSERELRFTLRDNGVGASELKEGIGMSGIRERLAPLGGVLLARNTVDGFELLVTIPYVDAEH
jgi:signal transduction histidine kinase